MTEEELLDKAELDSEWINTFVVESNLIDPQPGENNPGQPIYDLHKQALLHAISAGVNDCYALPRELHKLLLADHPSAGVRRTQQSPFGLHTLDERHVAYCTWRWNAEVRDRIGSLRTERRNAAPEARQTEVWGLHCELMNIRPFELYNGRVGRLLMVNHAILVGEVPWIVYAEDRADYLDTIRTHASAAWTHQPLGPFSTVRDREW